MFTDLKGADQAGLQIAIHAIGDRANRAILNLYERLEKENGPRDRRLRIEHAQHLTAADIPRFAQLHVIASMQPYHAIDDGCWAEKRLGPDRIRYAYDFRSLLDSGATLAFGSDWPVAPLDPIMGIYAAATRRTLDGKNPNGWVPEQKITVEQAVHAYTVGAAYAQFEEKQKGSLEPGKLADIAVLSTDIFHIDPDQIEKTRVELTILDGRVIYDASAPNQPELRQGSYTEAATTGTRSAGETLWLNLSRMRRHMLAISVLKTIMDSAVQAPRQSAASPRSAGGADSANTKVSRTDMRKVAQSSNGHLRRLKTKKTTHSAALTLTPAQPGGFAGTTEAIPSHRAVPVTSANRKRTPTGTSRRSRDRRMPRRLKSAPRKRGRRRVIPRL